MSPFHFRLSAAKNFSSFQLLPASLFTGLLQLFLGLPLFLFPWGFQNSAFFGISPSYFLNVWPIHLNFLFLISTFISSCLVTFHRSLLEIIFAHHSLNIYLRHLFTKVCSLRWMSFVTSQVSHPYKSTDFTQALNILISVSFRSHFGWPRIFLIWRMIPSPSVFLHLLLCWYLHLRQQYYPNN